MADLSLTWTSNMKTLDDYLLTRTYITGYEASKDDLIVFAALSKAPPAELVNVYRWYHHIQALLNISNETEVKKLEEAMSGITLEGSVLGASDCAYFAQLTLN